MACVRSSKIYEDQRKNIYTLQGCETVVQQFPISDSLDCLCEESDSHLNVQQRIIIFSEEPCFYLSEKVMNKANLDGSDGFSSWFDLGKDESIFSLRHFGGEVATFVEFLASKILPLLFVSSKMSSLEFQDALKQKF
ncbi:hypothetical protein TNCV_5123651 [Trichonephila clavipes]|nr:hypothetical protein TNCV_5123651 [Trichonephila clavipes]